MSTDNKGNIEDKTDIVKKTAPWSQGGTACYGRKVITNKFVKEMKGYAVFHQWGCDYEEFESGAGNYSTAIVEYQDGTVENLPADMIKFVAP